MSTKIESNHSISSRDDLTRFYRKPQEETREQREARKANEAYQKIQAKYYNKLSSFRIDPDFFARPDSFRISSTQN